MIKPLLILGAGGHASVIVDILREQKREIIGVVSPQIDLNRAVFKGIQHYTCDEDILDFATDTVRLVNGIGAMPGASLRTSIYRNFISLGYEFETVVSSSAVVSSHAVLAAGSQIFPNATVQTGANIGENTIINSGAIIEHDCLVGKNNHVAPGATLSGDVQSGENVHFGTGSSIIQSIIIGNGVVIGAGATITKNVADNTICFPARSLYKIMESNES